MNSRPTGCTPPNINTGAYAIITGAGLVEVWPAMHQQSPCTGFTSGQKTLLDPANSLDHRIDDVFYSPSKFNGIQAEIEERNSATHQSRRDSGHRTTPAPSPPFA